MFTGVYSGGLEVDKCRERLSKFCRGNGLDIGCGGIASDTRLYWENKIVPTAIGVDLSKTNLVGKAEKLLWFHDEVLDYVFSSHLLEHLSNPVEALIEWFRVLKKKDGLIILYLPLEGYYPSVGTEGANLDHKHNLNPQKLLEMFYATKIPFELILVDTRTEKDEYSFDFVVKKL